MSRKQQQCPRCGSADIEQTTQGLLWTPDPPEWDWANRSTCHACAHSGPTYGFQMAAEVERLKAPVAAIAAVRDHERAVTCPALAPDAAHQPRADATHWWAIGRLEVAALIDAALAATDEPLDAARWRRTKAIDEAKRVVLDACRAEHEARAAFLAPASPDTTAIAYSEATDARITAVKAWLALEVSRG